MILRDIVVIGASTGGVHALRTVVAALPEQLPACVCVVLHIGAHESDLPALLDAVGRLPAAHARTGDHLSKGRIYVAPPDHHLIVNDGRLLVSRGPKEHHTRPAIDPMFRSAALSAGPRVIGVLLTGAMYDGTAGLQAIKSCGGLVAIQDPADAYAPSMPSSALRGVDVDRCEPLERLAPLIAQWAGQPVPQAPSERPATLEREQIVAQGGGNALPTLREIGLPSSIVCPECGGSLWEIMGSTPARYRCHTGHGFSLASLMGAQSRSTEDALWSGVRALQERELVLRKVAALERAAGDEHHASQAEADAQRTSEQADALRRLIESR